ncbi:MAG: family 20 glycosylhydrolase [Clostridia bacterium]|nr:family 20 glycosylhydrolase [Clostridia bacterium]
MMNKVFPYCGFMLDSARHFIPLENVLKIIEAASVCGMNRMHWHLTDDQGWRVEIRRYPKLTEVGAQRGASCFWGEDAYENNCGFYTQQDIKRAVAFAREKGIEIVPEIEVPRHASAMLAAYPEYGCRRQDGDGVNGQPYKYGVLTYAGVFPNLICAGRDESLRFLEDILTEITELFPGPEIHIGGDEAVKQHWRRCPDCRRRMADNGLKDVHELQRWLVLRVGAFLKVRGKDTIVWNESLAGGMLPDNFIVQHWLGNDGETREFMARGGRVIISDANDYYISRTYFALSAHRLWRAGVPENARGYEDKLYGLECPQWGERITNPERMEYLLLPRMAITALKANGRAGTWNACVRQLDGLKQQLAYLGLNWAPREDWCPANAQDGACSSPRKPNAGCRACRVCSRSAIS